MIDQIAIVVFALSLFGAAYSYFIYPLVLRLCVGKSAGPRPGRSDFEPAVTLIVTAYNEADRIADKLENSLGLDYPRVEIIVASDCSTDVTDSIVKSYEDRGVTLVRTSERLGKESAQQQAIARATGDIVVFSDAGTRIEADAITRLVSYFEDPSVGAVSSEDRFETEDGTLVGEGAYVRYEMWLRKLESSLGGLVGLSGSFFAARREVCENWDIYAPSDFNTALNAARLGLKAVTAPDVFGYYRDLKDPAREYQRKVRTVLRGMTGLARHADVMSIRRFGVFGWQVISHKLMRWLVPVFLVTLLLSSLHLRDNDFVALVLAAQVAGYLLALIAHFRPALRRQTVLRLIYFFCQANVAIVHAAWNFASGRRMTIWQPSVR